MTLPVFVVDAFTHQPFAGNPAAVVLGHGDDAWMQTVGAEMKHSETAFVRPRGDDHFDLRWFTPDVEVDLCGHATLASAHVLFETKTVAADTTIVFHTRSGELTATRADGGAVTLDFPVTEPTPAPPNRELFDALGLTPREFLNTEGEWFMCVAESDDEVRALAPDMARLRAVTTVRGVYVTAASSDPGYDIVSRCFAPRIGIDEDPATGSMHCVLVAYWGPRLGRDELRAYQASARGGELTVLRKGDRALLTGHAVTILAGDLSA